MTERTSEFQSTWSRCMIFGDILVSSGLSEPYSGQHNEFQFALRKINPCEGVFEF